LKAPPNLPHLLDKVQRRGRPQPKGVLVFLDENTKWCQVAWETRGVPVINHWYELEKVKE